MAKPPSTSLWRPTNALAALGILFMKAVAKLPIRVQQGLGKALGTVIWYVFPYRQQVGLVNLRLCMPELDERERRQMLKRHYQSMGIGVFEMATAWYKPWDKVAEVGQVEGLEHIKAVEDSGRGAILITGHFTTLEIIGRILLCHHKLSCHYRGLNQPVLNAELERVRAQGMRKLLHFDKVKEFIRCLREGHFVWYTPDQGKVIKYSQILPFFGVPAVTNTATGRIARAGNAAILPFIGYRQADGSYKVRIYPEDPNMVSEDPVKEGMTLNSYIEKFVGMAPEQYFWLHKRFKYRGPDYEDVYARK